MISIIKKLFAALRLCVMNYSGSLLYLSVSSMQFSCNDNYKLTGEAQISKLFINIKKPLLTQYPS